MRRAAPGLAGRERVAAALHAGGSDAVPLDDLHAAPALFPFEMAPVMVMSRTDLYEVVRQGGGLEVAVLQST